MDVQFIIVSSGETTIGGNELSAPLFEGVGFLDAVDARDAVQVGDAGCEGLAFVALQPADEVPFYGRGEQARFFL